MILRATWVLNGRIGGLCCTEGAVAGDFPPVARSATRNGSRQGARKGMSSNLPSESDSARQAIFHQHRPAPNVPSGFPWPQSCLVPILPGPNPVGLGMRREPTLGSDRGSGCEAWSRGSAARCQLAGLEQRNGLCAQQGASRPDCGGRRKVPHWRRDIPLAGLGFWFPTPDSEGDSRMGSQALLTGGQSRVSYCSSSWRT